MSFNYRVYNHEIKQNCGHMHHSERTANECREHLGWSEDVCTIYRVLQGRDNTERKKLSIHARRKSNYVVDDAAKYKISADFIIKADAENLAVDKFERWLNNAKSSNDYVTHKIMDVQEVSE